MTSAPAASPTHTRFILMPSRGLLAATHSREADLLGNFQPGRDTPFGFRGRNSIRVLDQIRDHGPRLIDVPTRDIQAFRAHHPSLRLVPIRLFQPQVAELALSPSMRAGRPPAGRRYRVRVLDAAGQPVTGCEVIAFTNLASRTGTSGRTDAEGHAELTLPSQMQRLDALVLRPAQGFWSHMQRDLRMVAEAITVRLKPLQAGQDVLHQLHADTAVTAGSGVRVGVVDAGVGPHPDVPLTLGRNLVVGEDAGDFHDNGLHQGTHAAGIIGASPGGLVQSLAPAASLLAYRVFAKDAHTATNYAIAKAIDCAVQDGCHLINLGLANTQSDDATRDAVNRALEAGTVVVAANGNDGRRPVGFPAHMTGVVAVSAAGYRGSYPANSMHAWHEDSLQADAAASFYLARFSNVGMQTRFAGPGVGVVSAVPGGHAAMDGTAVATATVTGRLAALWAADAELMALPASLRRTAAVLNTAMVAGRLLGLGAHFEGDGRL